MATPCGRRNAPAERGARPRARPCVHASQKSAFRTDVPPVPKPTQVGGYKDTKARERNLVKELGNIAP